MDHCSDSGSCSTHYRNDLRHIDPVDGSIYLVSYSGSYAVVTGSNVRSVPVAPGGVIGLRSVVGEFQTIIYQVDEGALCDATHVRWRQVHNSPKNATAAHDMVVGGIISGMLDLKDGYKIGW